MDFLVDTHAIIWFITDDEKLPQNVKETIQRKENNCYASIVSFWEIGIKYSLGRLILNSDIDAIFQIIEDSGFEILPVSPKHIVTNTNLPFHHQDPFDRLLIAQALTENLILLSKDHQFSNYDVSLFWE